MKQFICDVAMSMKKPPVVGIEAISGKMYSQFGVLACFEPRNVLTLSYFKHQDVQTLSHVYLRFSIFLSEYCLFFASL